jgi:4-amino-4-deoxy-L-arabinose transferase-like glycosyltransferase
MRLRPTLTAWIVAGIAFAAVLVVRPVPQVNRENIAFIEQGQAVLRGETPMFFHAGGETWLPPIPVYLNALAQSVIGPIRAGQYAGAIAGAVNIALVFLIAHTITGHSVAAFASALTLLLTGSHTALALDGTAAIYPAPFLLLWLYLLLVFLKRDLPGALYGAAASLGLCVYAHPAGPLTAVFLWLLTLAVTWRRNRARVLTATLTFIAMWVPAAAWFYLHPDTYPDTFGRWVILKSHIRNPLDLLGAFFNANTLGNRASLYWGFWDPSWLFFRGESTPAPLLWLEAPLIGVALIRIRHLAPNVATVLIGSTLVVPLAGSTFGIAHYLPYAATVLPLLAILSGFGVDQLVGLVARRRPLEDDVAMVPVDGWDGDDVMPRR